MRREVRITDERETADGLKYYIAVQGDKGIVMRNKVRQTHVVFERCAESRLTFRPATSFDYTARFLKLVKEHSVGDPEFEEEVFVEGEDPGLLAQVAGNSKQREALFFLFENGCRSFEIDGHTTSLVFRGNPFDLNREFQIDEQRSTAKLQAILDVVPELIQSLQVSQSDWRELKSRLPLPGYLKMVHASTIPILAGMYMFAGAESDWYHGNIVPWEKAGKMWIYVSAGLAVFTTVLAVFSMTRSSRRHRNALAVFWMSLFVYLSIGYPAMTRLNYKFAATESRVLTVAVKWKSIEDNGHQIRDRYQMTAAPIEVNKTGVPVLQQRDTWIISRDLYNQITPQQTCLQIELRRGLFDLEVYQVTGFELRSGKDFCRQAQISTIYSDVFGDQ